MNASASKPSTSEEPKKANKQLDEFMEVMQSRAKKGPSWANDAATAEPAVPEPSSSTLPSTKKQADNEDVAMGDAAEGAPVGEPMSDMEWLKQRMSANVDKVVEEKAFEQSDDEGDAGDMVSRARLLQPRRHPDGWPRRSNLRRQRNAKTQRRRLFFKPLAYSYEI